MRKLGAVAAVMACGLAICGAFALAAKLENGNFEKGTFKGWTHKQEGDSGDWYVYKGRPTAGELVGGPPRMRGLGPRLGKPVQGKYAAGTAQGDPGTRLLFRSLKLKPGHKRTVSFLLRYQSFAELASPDTLHAGGGIMPRAGYSRGGVQGDNQQYRVDVMRKSAGAYSLKSSDVLKNLLASQPMDPLKSGWKRYSFNLSSVPAGKVKLRVAEVDNAGVFLVAFDDLKLKQVKK